MLEMFFWKGFLSNRLRLATISEIVLTDINFIPDRWHGIYIGRIAFDYFIPLTKNVFLTPTAGINFSYAFFSNRHLYLSGNIHPKLVYFLKNQLLEVGFLVRTPGKRIAGPTEADSDIENWEGSIVLAFEQFLQNNLSLRLEYRGGIFGDRFHGEIIFNENPIPSNDFRIGMNYFF